MTGAVAIAKPALVKRKAMAKTPTARLRSDRLGGLGGTAPTGKLEIGTGISRELQRTQRVPEGAQGLKSPYMVNRRQTMVSMSSKA